MRVVLVTMNDIGKGAFDALVESMDLVALFTVKERGNHYMDMTDFTDLARKHSVPLYKVSNINDPDAAEQMRALKPDYCMSLGWKQIVRDHMLAIPRIGWIGGHPAFLRLRGEPMDPTVLSAPGNEPLQYAIRGRYAKTGMSLIWLRASIDTGEVFARGQILLDAEHRPRTRSSRRWQASRANCSAPTRSRSWPAPRRACPRRRRTSSRT